MSKFKVGDLIEARDFSGATGKYLVPDKIYRVSDIELDHNNYLLALEGEVNNAGDPLKAYDSRFILHSSEKMDGASEKMDGATEYEEAMEFDRLVNG